MSGKIQRGSETWQPHELPPLTEEEVALAIFHGIVFPHPKSGVGRLADERDLLERTNMDFMILRMNYSKRCSRRRFPQRVSIDPTGSWRVGLSDTKHVCRNAHSCIGTCSPSCHLAVLPSRPPIAPIRQWLTLNSTQQRTFCLPLHVSWVLPMWRWICQSYFQWWVQSLLD